MGGTTAMRAAKDAYLPKQPREDQQDYDYRLKTSTLFPAFARTVGVMAGFNPRPPLLAGDALRASRLPARIAVSIRARHCWRAMRFTTNALPVLYFFLFSRERLFDHSTGQTDLCEQGGKA